MSNASWRVRLDPPLDVVLRRYQRDVAACQKEADLLALLGSSVPAPEPLVVSPSGDDAFGPFMILRWVDGMTLRALKRTRDADALAQAATSVGETLAAIGRFTFDRAGWLEAGPRVGAPLLDGDDAMPRFVDQCLASPALGQRLTPSLIADVHDLARRWAPRLHEIANESHLVHCDFGGANIIVDRIAGQWRVAAVLDWEFAVSASPLIDVGHFLRYESDASAWREPHFSRAFAAHGGELPNDWRELARVLDLTALLEMLTRPSLPQHVERDLLELVTATVETIAR